MTEAQKLLAHASKFAQAFFKAHGQVVPMFDIVGADGRHHVVSVAYHTPEDKDAVSDMIRQKLTETQAVRYAWMTEVWKVEAPDDLVSGKLAVALARAGRLEDHDDRTEMVMISVEDRETRELLSREYRILRPEHGKATLAPPRDTDMTHQDVRGRFIRMFDE